MKHSPILLLITLVIVSTAAGASNQPQSIVAHGMAMNGDLKYAPDFRHFDYVNPQAPKGGRLRMAAIGTFDSLNQYIAKGNPAEGLGAIYDTLMASAEDEPFSKYGLLAEKIEYPQNRSWVIFHLNPNARFADDKPVTAMDVEFTFNTLIEKGSPLYKRYYGDVSNVEVLDARRIKFSFGQSTNREMPLIMGQLPVLPRHYWKNRDFGRTTLDPPLGSGPYKVTRVDQGRSIVYTLNEDYWGRDLPVNRGRYNFKHIRYDYYRDAVVSLAAFKSGEYDFRLENISKQWAKDYTGPPFKKGLIKKESIKNGIPAGMQCFAMNQRRPLFADRRVRYALAHAFDFEWTNKNLFYGAYQRTTSYFENSEMAAVGLPSQAELAILDPFRKELWPEVFTQAYTPPSTRGEHGLRKNLLEALDLLNQAGWQVKKNVLRHRDSGKPFTFEILLAQPSFERVVLPFAANLKKLGIRADVRVVDTSQYINRLRSFDFDMIVAGFGQSLSPGNEQRWYWSSEAAKAPGTNNYCGIQNPAVDRLVELIISADTREELVNRCKALDRALLWGHYVIPHWYSGVFNVAYSSRIKHSENLPPYDIELMSWWSTAGK